MPLQSHQRTKLDSTDDQLFYRDPRFVTHVDDGFIQQLTEVYRQYLQPNTILLDLMSSWVSHLPPEMSFEKVVGHGLNAAELAKNPRLDAYFVQNLNQNLQLPQSDHTFDAVLIAVSVQYLQYPEKIFSELYRILKPQGMIIISFSNRMFYQKAIQAWRDSSDQQHLQLVQSYINAVEGLQSLQIISNPSSQSSFLSWMGLGSDPFFALITQRMP